MQLQFLGSYSIIKIFELNRQKVLGFQGGEFMNIFSNKKYYFINLVGIGLLFFAVCNLYADETITIHLMNNSGFKVDVDIPPIRDSQGCVWASGGADMTPGGSGEAHVTIKNCESFALRIPVKISVDGKTGWTYILVEKQRGSSRTIERTTPERGGYEGLPITWDIGPLDISFSSKPS